MVVSALGLPKKLDCSQTLIKDLRKTGIIQYGEVIRISPGYKDIRLSASLVEVWPKVLATEKDKSKAPKIISFLIYEPH